MIELQGARLKCPHGQQRDGQNENRYQNLYQPRAPLFTRRLSEPSLELLFAMRFHWFPPPSSAVDTAHVDGPGGTHPQMV